jgi:PAS domain S-box-containing protein
MSEPINLLLVEDNENDAILVVHELRNAGFDVTMERVQTMQEMQISLSNHDWDAIISDFKLPSFSAPKALEILRKSGKDLPFIVVSGNIGEETAVEIMRAGAHDYLMKDNLNRLAEALRREIRDARERDERRRARVALRESEQQLRLLFERSSDAIFVIDKQNGLYLDANKAAEKLSGLTFEELRLKNVYAVDPLNAKERIQKLSDADGPLNLGEVTYLQPSGNIRIAELTILPVNDTIAFGVAHDITEQIQSANALKHRAQELEALYHTSLEINTQTDLLPLLQMIVEQAASLINAKMGGLYLLQPNGKTLELVVAHNLPGFSAGLKIQVGEGLSGKIVQSGQTTTIEDYSNWPGHASIYDGAPFRRVMGVPLRVKGNVIGVINITDDQQTDPYSPDEIRLVSLFADQAAIAVENTRLLDAVQRELTERKQAELALRESKERYRIVVTEAPLISFVIDSNGIFTLSEGKGLSSLGLLPGEVVGQSVFDVYREYPEIVEDMRAALVGETRHRDIQIGKTSFEIHYIPILENNRVNRVIGVATDITERKQAEQALQRRLKELTILHNLARASIIVNTLDELIELVTQEVGNSFYPDNFGVLFLDETKKVLRAHPSYRGRTTNITEIAELEKSISGLVVISGKPRRIANVRQETAYLEVTADIRSELCVPIKTGEQIIGVINAESKQFNFFSEDDERLLLTIANQMAIAIERIRLFNSERERRQESETLRQATAALSTSLDLDHVLESILTSLKQVVPYDSASVFMLEGDHLRITSAHGVKNVEQVIGETFPVDNSLFQEVQTAKRPIILADAQLDPRFKQWGETFDVHGWMSVPLITRGEVIGYITLDNRKKSAYSQEASALAQAFAHQAAAAIENARLFKGMQHSLEELNLAYESTIEGWSKAMDLRDRETEGHTLRVTQMTTKLAQAMGIGGEDLVHIRRGSLLHDIGKMGVPDRILLKPDRLKEDELVLMRLHPQHAYDMLSPISYLHPALSIPYCHHEHWDGSGYPQGLKGEEIPLAARLFAIVDVWDALTSDRPYRPAWTHQETITYIRKLSGIYFDPNIVDKFMEMLGKDDSNT